MNTQSSQKGVGNGARIDPARIIGGTRGYNYDHWTPTPVEIHLRCFTKDLP